MTCPDVRTVRMYVQMYACVCLSVCLSVCLFVCPGHVAFLLSFFRIYLIKIHLLIPRLAPPARRLSKSSTLLKPILEVFVWKPKLPGVFEPQKKISYFQITLVLQKNVS